MRSDFLLACCIDNNKGKCTLFHCVSLCVGLQTRDLVPYLLKDDGFINEGDKQLFELWKKNKQELQEVLKFPIEIFRNLEASLKSELLYF